MIYCITKILNNNVVASRDKEGNEVLVTGNGIGFGTKIGQKIASEKIVRVFIPETNAFRNKFVKLVNDISYEYFDIAEKIKELAESELKVTLDQNLIISLADHISFAISQYENNTPRTFLMNEEIERFYPDEYRVGLQAVLLVEEKFNVKCPPAEAATFAFHIVNSQTGGGSNDAIRIMESIRDIIKIVETEMNIQIHKDTLDYSRMVIHLKFFLKRVLKGKTSKEQFGQLLLNPDEGRFKGITKSLKAIDEYMKKNYNHGLDEDERVYILIHIARVVEGQEN